MPTTASRATGRNSRLPPTTTEEKNNAATEVPNSTEKARKAHSRMTFSGRKRENIENSHAKALRINRLVCNFARGFYQGTI